MPKFTRANSDLFEDISKGFAQKNGVGKTFVDSVNWDIFVASMEDYYFALLRQNRKMPLFFSYLLEVYARGNVPCGIIGEIKEEFGGKQVDFSQFILLVY